MWYSPKNADAVVALGGGGTGNTLHTAKLPVFRLHAVTDGDLPFQPASFRCVLMVKVCAVKVKALCSTRWSVLQARLWTRDAAVSSADRIKKRVSQSLKRRPTLTSIEPCLVVSWQL